MLSRWLRRKRRPDKEPAGGTLPAAAPEPEAPGAKPPDPPPLPAIEALDESSDYSGFLSPGVDETLQRLALRKLFGNARFNVRDGLDDYDEDYRSFEALGDTLTADLRHRLEQELHAGPGPDAPREEVVGDAAADSAAEAEPQSTEGGEGSGSSSPPLV